MSIQIHEQSGRNVLEVRAKGQLTHRDYEQLVPRTKRMIQDHGKIRVLFEMSNFHGWSFEPMSHSISFDLSHFDDIDRVALVVDGKSWENAMTAFCHPFTGAEVRYFDRGQLLEARQWLEASPQAQSA
ncbi:MAG: STAS/SEC14 domain-containing protein [Thermoanaerobaculia bacterium]